MADVTLPEANFFDKYREKIAFDTKSDCWLWTAGKTSTGYGSSWGRGTTQRAHRQAYEAAHGLGSARGFVVRHQCDTPLCVNPAHLILGSQADNVRDREERGRRIAPTGGAHGRAKLTETDIKTIRATYVPRHPSFGGPALAGVYGVNQTMIGKIIRRERWAQVP